MSKFTETGCVGCADSQGQGASLHCVVPKRDWARWCSVLGHVALCVTAAADVDVLKASTTVIGNYSLAAVRPDAFSCSRSAAADKPTVGVFVVTSGAAEYRERVWKARQTWAADRNQPVLFVAAAANYELGVEATSCRDDEERGVCCKTIVGLRIALERFPSAQWLVRAVDDTFVFIDHLAKELRIFDADKFIYVGAPSVTLLCNIAKFASQCGELHGGGGGGVILSRALAQELVRHTEVFLNGCWHDDLFLGHFLRYVLDVHVQSLPGVLQEPRFARCTWHVSNVIPPCPLPFPPPVHALLDDWGPLQPFAPVDISRLALVHADPEIWPQLEALSRFEGCAVWGDGARLLAYAESFGRRVVGPHFRGAETLGVCTYRPSDRLASFSQAAARPIDMRPI
eukprot:TRINITY_DN56245_c0_g1_i1.p1 TRINITY_DN56245_c0_g1~~TRINITY_DN56245_c0_g1_i1.p1  ORF type:complete len:399 (+),score=52.58 TRINITY_DN56245_c0_g1_i1:67-1263(+)